jgi:vancomycin aglycone glucosyltransferase
MRFLLCGFGSRGDVQPMLALALALKERAHAATLVAPPDFEGWAGQLGIQFRSAGPSMQQALEQSADSGHKMIRAVPEILRHQFAALEPLVADCDVMVGSSLSIAAPSLAEKHGKRCHAVWFMPHAVPSSHYGPPHWTASPLFHRQDLPGWLNRLAWWFWIGAWNRLLLRPVIDPERRRLGLPRVADCYAHVIFQRLILAYDPALAPLAPDAPSEVVTQTGAWFFPEREELPADVEAFLAQGPPPVYVGFGSMPFAEAGATTRRILEALHAAGVRALISRGWAGLGEAELPPTVRVVGALPHGKLFPRCAAVVHHGGAGTTATAARAGVPQLLVPHYGDQFYWAHRVFTLGLSPPPAPRSRLTAPRLATALRACVADPAMRARAADFPRTMRHDGLARAVAIVEGGPRRS